MFIEIVKKGDSLIIKDDGARGYVWNKDGINNTT